MCLPLRVCVSVLLADATVPYEWGYIWGQLAGARVDSGDFSGAVAAGGDRAKSCKR